MTNFHEELYILKKWDKSSKKDLRFFLNSAFTEFRIQRLQSFLFYHVHGHSCYVWTVKRVAEYILRVAYMKKVGYNL